MFCRDNWSLSIKAGIEKALLSWMISNHTLLPYHSYHVYDSLMTNDQSPTCTWKEEHFLRLRSMNYEKSFVIEPLQKKWKN